MLNMLQMAFTYDNQSSDLSFYQGLINNIFTIIYILEAAMKITAFGKSYFNNAWNKFDFFVVVTSLGDFILKFFEGESTATTLLIGPQIARILRVLRLTRVIKLAEKD